MPRFIEIGFTPLLKTAYPDETAWVDTRVWSDGKGMHSAQHSIKAQIARIYSEIRDVLAIARNSGIEAIVVRARGSENSLKRGPACLLKRSLGLILEKTAIHLAIKHGCKLAVVDRRDECSVHVNDRRLLERCDLFFKRELPWSTWSLFEQMIPPRYCIGSASGMESYIKLEKKFRPISLGIEDETVVAGPLPPGDHQYQLFFAGTTHFLERRKMVQREIEALGSQGIKILAPPRGLSRSDFLQSIRNSMIAVSPGGVGWDCYRHYEIPSQGSVLLLEAPCHQMYQAPKHGVEAIIYDPSMPLGPIIQKWLEDPKALAEIAEKGHRWVMRHHTYRALGAYLADSLKSHQSE